jgi:hypothetical protein
MTAHMQACMQAFQSGLPMPPPPVMPPMPTPMMLPPPTAGSPTVSYLTSFFFHFEHLRLREVLGNSVKLVTLETLSLTKFSKHVFQEQGIHDCRKPGTCEALNSRVCKVRES